MTIEERLEWMEKELGRARRTEYWLVTFMVLLCMGLVAIALAGAAWAWAAKGKVEEARAQRFVLEDANGKTRGVLGVYGDGWGLSVADEANIPRAVLLISKDGPTLQMADSKGKTRLVFSVGEDGPRVQLWDEIGRTRVGLYSSDTSDGIALKDGEGRCLAAWQLIKDQATLGFMDKKGNVRAAFGGGPNQGGAFSLWGDNGKAMLQMTATSIGPMVILSDEKNKSGMEWSVLNGKTAIVLRDGNGEPRAVLGAAKEGVSIGLRDAKGARRVCIGTEVEETSVGRAVSHPESSIVLYGADGTLIWSAPEANGSH